MLNLPAGLEERIPVDENHSDMVKFKAVVHPTYVSILDRLTEFAVSAALAVENRLGLGALQKRNSQGVKTITVFGKAVNVANKSIHIQEQTVNMG